MRSELKATETKGVASLLSVLSTCLECYRTQSSKQISCHIHQICAPACQKTFRSSLASLPLPAFPQRRGFGKTTELSSEILATPSAPSIHLYAVSTLIVTCESWEVLDYTGCQRLTERETLLAWLWGSHHWYCSKTFQWCYFGVPHVPVIAPCLCPISTIKSLTPRCQLCWNHISVCHHWSLLRMKLVYVFQGKNHPTMENNYPDICNIFWHKHIIVLSAWFSCSSHKSILIWCAFLIHL